jgi:hypothetical protein
MGIQHQDRFHASAVGIVYEECCDSCRTLASNNVSKKACIWRADAHVLMNRAGRGFAAERSCRTAKGIGGCLCCWDEVENE